MTCDHPLLLRQLDLNEQEVGLFPLTVKKKKKIIGEELLEK